MSKESVDLRAPFPYFGGKSQVAALVWERFGAVANYVEPFFGSGAVLLGRPNPDGTETVNDLNGWVANFWRALQADPDAVAAAADWPVSELDLHARGDAIFYRDDWYAAQGLGSITEWIEWLRADPGNYNALIAGWWVWWQSGWIGDNWGRVQCRQRPHLGGAGTGVHRKRPHLGDAGKGVHRSSVSLRDYIRGLAARLRRVRICCGEWSRVCGPTPTCKQGLTAVFLDPPYSVADRADCYGEHEDREVAHAVREWCVANQNNPLMRIALCGYEGEHVLPGWECVAWKAHGGYANARRDGNANSHRERIWFSPHCVAPAQRTLFSGA